MSLFKSYPPSEITLDNLCIMTPRNVLEYIKDMHEDAEEKKQITRENVKYFLAEPCKRKEEEIEALKEEMEERRIGAKEVVHYLGKLLNERDEKIEALKKENEALKKENEVEKKEAEEEIEALKEESEDLAKEAWEKDNWSPHEGAYCKEEVQEEEPIRELTYDERLAQVEAKKASETAWENFKSAKDTLWKECFQECNEGNFYPHTIQYSEWSVRDNTGDIVAQGDKKPLKQHIMEHYDNGITLRLYAFNDREEWTLITHFDGKEWVYEEATS